MKDAAARLHKLLGQVPGELAAIPDSKSEEPYAPGKWSRKQVLGHLIDSASNNHQRFVRAQYTPSLSFPRYEQNEWVDSQQYQRESWTALIALWSAYNAHLAHVLSHIPVEKGKRLCKIGDGEPVTLAFLATDYVDHLEHHLEQILGAKS